MIAAARKGEASDSQVPRDLRRRSKLAVGGTVLPAGHRGIHAEVIN